MPDLMSHPAVAALLAGMFTWAFTTLGAGCVFTGRDPLSRRTLDIMLGVAAGVMIAASFWSLIVPALKATEHLGRMASLPVAAGIAAGAVLLRFIDVITPHLHHGMHGREGVNAALPKSVLLAIAVALHNFPEGLAIGVDIGASAVNGSAVENTSALALMIGIGLQNFPEGMAVSLPLLRDGYSKKKAFLVGMLSGVVEPLAAAGGAVFAAAVQSILPSVLGLAAGAMIYIVAEDVIPESHSSGNGNAAAMGCIAGFIVMMILDTALAV